MIWAMWHSFSVSFSFVAVLKVAQEMEDPFGTDPNDLPLITFHDEFNFRLERLLHEPPPKVDLEYNPSSAYIRT